MLTEWEPKLSFETFDVDKEERLLKDVREGNVRLAIVTLLKKASEHLSKRKLIQMVRGSDVKMSQNALSSLIDRMTEMGEIARDEKLRFFLNNKNKKECQITSVTAPVTLP